MNTYNEIYLKLPKFSGTDFNKPWRKFLLQNNIDKKFPELMNLNKRGLIKTLQEPKVYICKDCHKEFMTLDLYPDKRVGRYTFCSQKCHYSSRSKRQRGNKNSVHKMSEETKVQTKIKQSISTKRKIANGEFTPCVTNSWARSRCYVSGIPFRSSWESLFWTINQNCLFEKIRIPYSINGSDHSYIIDFVDEDNKILYEIKPEGLTTDKRVQAKEKAAKQWGDENGYIFKFISEDYFRENIQNIEMVFYNLSSSLDYNTARLMKNNIKIFKALI